MEREHRSASGATAGARSACRALGLILALTAASACRSAPPVDEPAPAVPAAERAEPAEGQEPAASPEPAAEVREQALSEGQEEPGSAPGPAAAPLPVAEPAPIGQAPPVIRGRAPEGDAGSAATEQGLVPDAASKLNGWLSLRYWARFAGSEDDHDLYASLSLDYGDAERDRVSGHFFGRTIWDVDGRDGDGPDPLFSLQDTRDDLTGDVFEAYVDLNRFERVERVRLGRQQIYETPELAWFDGVRVESRRMGEGQLQLGLYGGLPVHLWESSSSGDALLGTWLEGRPWEGGRWRLDWMHLEDERVLSDHEDDLFGLGFWQALGERAHVQAQYTRLEDRHRDLRLSGTWFDPEKDLIVRGAYYSVLETQRALSLELDPFFEILREYRPFHQAGLTVSKGLGRHFLAEIGADLRRLMDSDDEGTFNHDFERYHLTLANRGAFGRESLTLSLTGDLWDSDRLEVTTWGADITDAVRKDLSWSVGSYYALYKEDLVNDDEREDVRTWYLKLRKRQGKTAAYQASYEFEDSDIEEFHTVRLGVTWHF